VQCRWRSLHCLSALVVHRLSELRPDSETVSHDIIIIINVWRHWNFEPISQRGRRSLQSYAFPTGRSLRSTAARFSVILYNFLLICIIICIICMHQEKCNSTCCRSDSYVRWCLLDIDFFVIFICLFCVYYLFAFFFATMWWCRKI